MRRPLRQRVVGAMRLTLSLLAIVVLMPLLIALSYLPLRRRGVPWAAWGATMLARTLLLTLGIRLRVTAAERLEGFDGFIFPNHSAFVDIPLLMATFPTRWVAAAEIGRWPFVGRLARALGTVFVDRDDKVSRHAARASLVGVDTFPPIVLFPEGRVNPTPGVAPLRHGAFEIAVAGAAPILPVAIRYSDPALIAELGRTRGLFDGGWCVAARSGPLSAELIYLEPIDTTAAEPADLAAAVRARLADTL